MKSLFFNNRLFLNVIRTIILYSYYRALGEGREKMLWGFCFCFSFRVLFLIVLGFFLVGHFCIAGICAEPYSGKNNDM